MPDEDGGYLIVRVCVCIKDDVIYLYVLVYRI